MAEFFKALERAAAGEETPLGAVLDALPFDDRGLLPAIAQDAESGEVLMLAWVSRAALERTLTDGYACYYSRSRQALWLKGESSGHRQALVSLRLDCDGDAVLYRVRQEGPACHTNRPTCFYLEVDGSMVRVLTDPVA
ncbi:MAG: phosphoribosyl-AMP cyclohydrolase [Pseudomonadota bacterium]